MKIDGKVITGMYVYSPEIEYTKNDFVIHSGIIYTCIKDVIGEDPGKSDCFKVYLGDKSIDSKEYLDFLEKGEGENKYISVEMLQTVMSYYLLGPTGKGIIGDYICYDPENFRISLRNSKVSSEKFTDPWTVISDIMAHENINHAHFRVSRFLPEISGYVGGALNISDETLEEDKKSVILRQYTYLGSSKEKIRLQELIDPIDGVIWYRSGEFTDKGLSKVTSWVCSVINSRALKAKVEDLIKIYSARLKVLNSMETHLKSNFRYRKFSGINGQTKIISLGKDLIEKEITVTVSERTPEGYIRNYETSVDLSNKSEEGKVPEYLIGGNYIMKTDEDRYLITLLNKTTGESPENAWFSGLYYKEYYGIS